MSQARLKRDLDQVMHQIHNLLDKASTDTSDGLQDKVKQVLGGAQQKVVHLADGARVKTKAAAKATDQYVHQRPWQAIGVGAVIGLVLGLLATTRR